jgi:hypothetical protein
MQAWPRLFRPPGTTRRSRRCWKHSSSLAVRAWSRPSSCPPIADIHRAAQGVTNAFAHNEVSAKRSRARRCKHGPGRSDQLAPQRREGIVANAASRSRTSQKSSGCGAGKHGAAHRFLPGESPSTSVWPGPKKVPANARLSDASTSKPKGEVEAIRAAAAPHLNTPFPHGRRGTRCKHTPAVFHLTSTFTAESHRKGSNGRRRLPE